MKSRIVIVSGFPLTGNPRVVKEATVLADAGYEVEVLTSILHPQLAEQELARAAGERWRAIYVVDNRASGLLSRQRWNLLRARTKVSKWLYRALRIASVNQLGYCGPELLEHCLSRRADLYIVHNEQALWVGVELLKRGYRVGVDFEDWYSEDLWAEQRRDRPIELLKGWESFLARNAAYSLTTSKSLAQALSRAYDAPAPRVVLNTFPEHERETLDHKSLDRVDPSRLSICWFSQTIGPQRGLEDLMQATHHTQAAIEIHLRGGCKSAYREHLLSMVPQAVRANVFFHDLVPHNQLLSRIAEHDIGFAGEIAHCPSRDLTITNKAFQYFLAGIPVIASRTSGQVEVHALVPDAVQLYSTGDSAALSAAIDRWASHEVRENARDKALQAAQGQFNWEKSADVIRATVDEALSK